MPFPKRRRKYTGPIRQHGDTWTVQRFAWTPRRVGLEVIWLMMYVEKWGYYESTYPAIEEGRQIGSYTVGGNVKLSEKVI